MKKQLFLSDEKRVKISTPGGKINLRRLFANPKWTIAVAILSLVWCFGFQSAGEASAQAIPAGSYQKSCTVLGVDGYLLKAICNTGGLINDKKATILNFEFCIGDISNYDGMLFCPKDLQAEEKAREEEKKKAAQNAPKFTPQERELIISSTPAFVSAAVVVLGRYPYGEEEIGDWNKLMTNNYGMSQQVKEGLRFSDGVTFLKKYIAKPEGSLARAHLISRAFYEVYGRPSSPTEQAYWDTQVKAQQSWYVPLVSKIREELNSKPPERRTVIHTVYYYAMGRYATDGDMNYWASRKEDYKQMLEANRAWLYSPNGAKDLVETVTRALQVKNGKKPIDSEVKNAMAKFTEKKMIYQQMIK
jgi:hypothetical protein